MQHPIITGLRFLCLIFFLHFTQSAHAQSDFSAATIVLNNGDTLIGFLSNPIGRIAPKEISFSNTSSGINAVKYHPSQVRWYRYKGGEWYFGFTGQIESSSLNQGELTNDSSMHTVVDSMFIRAVMLSRASLFYARDRNDRIHLFIQKDRSEIMELAYKKYYIDEIVIANYRNQITRRAIMGNELYKGQLISAFSDCKYLSASILSRPIEYAKNDLLALFEDYNKCRGEKIFYKEPKDKGKVLITFAGGITLNNVNVSSALNSSWQNIDFKNSIGGQIAMGINWIFPRVDEKWSWYNEAALRYYSLNGQKNSALSATYEIDAVYAKIVSMIRYQIPSGKVIPYFGFGMSNNFALYFNGTENPQSNNLSIVDSYRVYEQGFITGTGVNWNNINFEIRYERSNGWSDYSDLSTKFNTLYFLAGYTF